MTETDVSNLRDLLKAWATLGRAQAHIAELNKQLQKTVQNVGTITCGEEAWGVGEWQLEHQRELIAQAMTRLFREIDARPVGISET